MSDTADNTVTIEDVLAAVRRARLSDRACAYSPCGKPFSPKRSQSRFCSPACRKRAWNDANPRIDISRLQKQIA